MSDVCPTLHCHVMTGHVPYSNCDMTTTNPVGLLTTGINSTSSTRTACEGIYPGKFGMGVNCCYSTKWECKELDYGEPDCSSLCLHLRIRCLLKWLISLSDDWMNRSTVDEIVPSEFFFFFNLKWSPYSRQLCSNYNGILASHDRVRRQQNKCLPSL